MEQNDSTPTICYQYNQLIWPHSDQRFMSHRGQKCQCKCWKTKSPPMSRSIQELYKQKKDWDTVQPLQWSRQQLTFICQIMQDMWHNTLQWLESYAHHAHSHTSYIKWSQLVLYHIKDGTTCAIIEAMSPRALMHYFLICNCWTKTWFFITMILSSQHHVCTIRNAENTLQVKEQLPISITVIRLVIF